MKNVMLVAAVLAFFAVLVHGAAWADTVTVPVPGQQALPLTQNLYCQIKNGFNSPTGLFIGLAIAIVGLWKLIQGNVSGGLMFIIAGALLTALPSMAESFLNGIGVALGDLSSTKGIASDAPKCTS